MKKKDDNKRKDGKQKYENLHVGRVFEWQQANWIKLENGQAACISTFIGNKKKFVGQLINLKPDNWVYAISYLEVGSC